MKNKALYSMLSLALVAALTGCATTTETTEAPAQPQMEAGKAPLGTRYPTEDRLQYMFKCIRAHDHKESATTPCGCKIDKIAEKLTFIEYVNATAVTQLGKIPGESGAPFRGDKARDLKKELKAAEEYGEKSCFGK